MYFEPNAVANRDKLTYVHDVMLLALGCVGGILGLEAAPGVAFFVVGYLVTTAAFVLVCKPTSRHFENPVVELVTANSLRSGASYLMTWCFTYALVQ